MAIVYHRWNHVDILEHIYVPQAITNTRLDILRSLLSIIPFDNWKNRSPRL